jgi:hypothetical protein
MRRIEAMGAESCSASDTFLERNALLAQPVPQACGGIWEETISAAL